MPNILISLFAFAAYGVLAAYFWRAQARGEGDVLSRGAIGHLVLAPLALHGYLLVQDIFSGGGFNLGVLNALSLILWLTLLVYYRWIAGAGIASGRAGCVITGIFPIGTPAGKYRLACF